MIDPDQLPIEPISEEPILTEEERQAEEKRKEENLRWLKEHNQWRPFDVEW